MYLGGKPREGDGSRDGKDHQVGQKGQGQLRTMQYQEGQYTSLRNDIDDTVDPACRKCGRYAETARHIALVCTHGEQMGRKWGKWEDMDEHGRWVKRVQEGDREYTVDLWKCCSTIWTCVKGMARFGFFLRRGPERGVVEEVVIYSPESEPAVEEEGSFRLFHSFEMQDSHVARCSVGVPNLLRGGNGAAS